MRRSGNGVAVKGMGADSVRLLRLAARVGVWALLALTLSLSLAPLPAAAQELAVQAGNAPAELRCPRIRHRHWRRHHSGAVMVMPDSDELAAIPAAATAGIQHQKVVLKAARQHDDTRPFTMALWGDSHAASDYFSDEMMRTLGLAQDEVQPTFIPATMGRLGVRLPLRKFCLSDGWTHDYAYVTRLSSIEVDRGLGDIRSHRRGSYLWADFRLDGTTPDLQSLDVLFAPPAPGMTVRVGITVDGGAEHIVELDPDAQGVLHIAPARPMSIVKLRVLAGKVVLQGFTPHYVHAPALYFDTFAIPGATAHAWKVLDPAYLKQRGGAVDYDMVIMEYGTNEGNDINFAPDKYESDLRTSLHNLRAAYPDAICVLVGPPDRGVLEMRRRLSHWYWHNHHRYRRYIYQRSHENPLKYARIHQTIGEIQQAVGKDYGCAYWSWQSAMGGPGAAYGWRRHFPPLMSSGLTHLTATGYQISGRAFTQDIGLAQMLAARGKLVRADAAVQAAAHDRTLAGVRAERVAEAEIRAGTGKNAAPGIH